MSLIDRSTDIQAALRRRQGGFLMNPFRFGGGGGGGGDPYFSNVSLLLHMDGTNGSTTFTDNSPSPKTVTVNGNAKISTDQSKFGGASGLFDGSGDYLSHSSNTDFTFGTGDFTVEFWIRPNSTANSNFIDFRGSVGTGSHFRIGFGNSIEGTLNKVVAGIASDTQLVSTSTFSTATWYYIAVTRSGTSMRLFIDGSIQATATDSTSSGNNGLIVASYRGTTAYFNGNIDDVRITKGVARYTANFTPPTAAFPNF